MIESHLLTESEAAEFLRLKPKTLARWRWAGEGPTYRKIGGAVRYAVSDLEQFLEASARQSTSDEGATPL
jgi:predicted DNA-binding transcriptional regulator AlpA